MPKWKRVYCIKPYIESGDYLKSEKDINLQRLYSYEDKEYPLLSIHVDPDFSADCYGNPITGFLISASYKEKSGDWWSWRSINATIPLELYEDLLEMLKDFKQMAE